MNGHAYPGKITPSVFFSSELNRMFSLDGWLADADGSREDAAADSGTDDAPGGDAARYRLGWLRSGVDDRTQAPLQGGFDLDEWVGQEPATDDPLAEGFDLDAWLLEGLGDPPAFPLRDGTETERRDGLLLWRAAPLALAVLLVGVAVFGMGFGGPGVTGDGPDRASAAGPPIDTPTPSPTPTASPTASPTPTSSPSPTPTASPSPTASPTPTASPSPTPTATPSPTPTPSDGDSGGVDDVIDDTVDEVGDAIDDAVDGTIAALDV